MSTSLSADNKLLLNQMNKTAAKVALGDLIDAIADVADQSAFVIVKSGIATLAAGATLHTIAVTGAVATDMIQATIKTVGAAAVYSSAFVAATDGIVVTSSATPGAGHVVMYSVIRAVV